MSLEDKAKEGIQTIKSQIAELQDIAQRAIQDEDADAAWERLRRWKSRTVRLLSEKVNPSEGKKLQEKSGLIAMGEPLRNFANAVGTYRAFLQSLTEELEKHPEDILSIPTPSDTTLRPLETPQPTSSRGVFIIHGHDEVNLLKLEKLLKERWNLEPVVLISEAGKGRTLIEKFEEEARRANFAIALLTADDLVRTEEGQYGQPRPNVVFELGWFYGRLGRARVCILFKKGTKIHSDLDGISRIQFDDSINEKAIKIEQELKEAGLLES